MKLTTWISMIILLCAGLLSSNITAAEIAESKSISSSIENIELININSADADTLTDLPGVGEKKAQAILEYRKRNGKFNSVEELVNVKGIGKNMMAKLIGMITI